MTGQKSGLRDKMALARIDEQQIGVIANRNRPFPFFEAEALRHTGPGKLRDQRPIEPGSEERADKLLSPHNAAPNGKKVIALFHRRRARRVIRAQRIDIA